MSCVLEYKGYHTKIEFISESKTLRGKIEGINDFVDFESENVIEIENEFHAAVDDYLEFCAEVGKTPEKEYKGTFNVRISPDLHKKLAISALRENCSLNAEVEKAIIAYLDQSQDPTKELTESVRDLTDTIRMNHARYSNETTISSSKVIIRESLDCDFGEEFMTS